MIVTIYSIEAPYKGKTFEVTTRSSPFYYTGTPITKVDKVTLRFILKDITDLSPVIVEGTRLEFEKLIHELQEAVILNKKDDLV